MVRPAEPPKDKVYFAVAQRGDTTALAIAYGPPPPLTFTMQRVSAGMAQNAVLAICAALWLGVTPEVNAISTLLLGFVGIILAISALALNRPARDLA